MKYERTEKFKRDYRRLRDSERDEFKRIVQEHFAPALERRLAEPAASWPAALRVKDVEGAPGVWEMTWSFTDPDGRATWEWIEIEGAPGVRWRRVGSHIIFKSP